MQYREEPSNPVWDEGRTRGRGELRVLAERNLASNVQEWSEDKCPSSR